METFLMVLVLLGVGAQLLFITKLIDEVRETRTQLMRQVSTTQSQLKQAKRSNPYPKMPRPKAEQHYEQQGVKRPERGSTPREVTASGTPVRIGKVARKLAGGSSSDAPGN